MGIAGLVLIGAGCTDLLDRRPDLGFTVVGTEAFGSWQVAPDVNHLQGSFENGDVMTYSSIKPNTGDIGKGATYANIVGYRKSETRADEYGFQYTFNGTNWITLDVNFINALGETPLKNGKALLLGPTDCEPSPACYGPTGPWMAIINTPNGVTPGGVFSSGEATTLEAFKAALTTVSIE